MWVAFCYEAITHEAKPSSSGLVSCENVLNITMCITFWVIIARVPEIYDRWT